MSLSTSSVAQYLQTMPPQSDNEYSSVRRSRRLSKQQPKRYYEGPEETCQPSSFIPTSKVSSPSPTFQQPDTLDPLFGTARVCHTRRRPKGNPPRPPNAFMLFRSDFWAREKQKEVPIERDHRDISRIAGHCWNNLDDEERARYKRLAAQRKEMHNLEHPGYQYIPSTRRERAKRKLRKGAEEEEERCRKLASFVMEGLSHADLREAMKHIEKKPASGGAAQSPSYGPTRSRRRRCSTFGRRPVIHAQKAVKVEKHESPSPAGRLVDGFDACSNVESILTEEASNHDSTDIKKEEEDLILESYLRPPSYDVVDPQFSFKHPGSPHLSSDSYLWYNSDEVSASMLGDAQPAPLPSFLGESLDFAVDFTDPFGCDLGNQSPFTPAVDQPQGTHACSSTFAMSADPLMLSGTHDSEMSQYFRFDVQSP